MSSVEGDAIQVACRHWAKLGGYCSYGDRCKFAHAPMGERAPQLDQANLSARAQRRAAWLQTQPAEYSMDARHFLEVPAAKPPAEQHASHMTSASTRLKKAKRRLKTLERELEDLEEEEEEEGQGQQGRAASTKLEAEIQALGEQVKKLAIEAQGEQGAADGGVLMTKSERKRARKDKKCPWKREGSRRPPRKKKNNKHRAATFARWLIETMGLERLQASSTGVVDVAGGKGVLSFQLQCLRGVPCTIVDPRCTNLTSVMERYCKAALLPKTPHLNPTIAANLRRLEEEEEEAPPSQQPSVTAAASAEPSAKVVFAGGELPEEQQVYNIRYGHHRMTVAEPRHIRTCLPIPSASLREAAPNQEALSCDASWACSTSHEKGFYKPYIAQSRKVDASIEMGDEERESIPSKVHDALKSCTAIIGMHADQATEPLIDWALALNKPFAVLPCCVFPNLFPERTAPQRELDKIRFDVLQGLSSGPQGDGDDYVDQEALALALSKAEQKLACSGEEKGQVRTHAQFVRYLKAKDPRIQTTQLDFSGRNTVVYMIP